MQSETSGGSCWQLIVCVNCCDVVGHGTTLELTLRSSTTCLCLAQTPHVAGVAARLWARGVCTNNVDCAAALKCLATPNLVSGATSTGSPNLLLYVPPGV